MTYDFVVGPSAPFVHARPAGHKYEGITCHWWGEPTTKPSFEGTVAWLTRPNANSSVHYVVEAGRVTQITDSAHKLTWHAGDGVTGPGNLTQIAIEVNPRWSDGDYATAAELIRDIRKVHGDLPLNPHNKWTNTQCPGTGDLQRLDQLARTTPGATMHPTDGAITQHFANYPQASGEAWGHTGRDYAGNIGATVRSIASGTVLYAGEHTPDHIADRLMLVRGSTNSGKHVIIQHDGWVSLSAHLNSIDVSTGARVTREQKIGGLGMTGRSTGPHLHYECILEPCISSPLFGRYDPQLQIDLEDITHVVTQAAAIEPSNQEAPLSASEVKQILAAIAAEGEKTRQYSGQVLVSGYSVGGTKYPGVAAVDIENQKRINKVNAGIEEIKEILTGKEV